MQGSAAAEGELLWVLDLELLLGVGVYILGGVWRFES